MYYINYIVYSSKNYTSLLRIKMFPKVKKKKIFKLHHFSLDKQKGHYVSQWFCTLFKIVSTHAKERDRRLRPGPLANVAALIPNR